MSTINRRSLFRNLAGTAALAVIPKPILAIAKSPPQLVDYYSTNQTLSPNRNEINFEFYLSDGSIRKERLIVSDKRYRELTFPCEISEYAAACNTKKIFEIFNLSWNYKKGLTRFDQLV